MPARLRRGWVAFAVGVGALASGPASAGAPAGVSSSSSDVLVIRSSDRSGLRSFGGMNPRGDLTLGRAIRLWGEPDSRTPRFSHDEGCRVRWRDLGLRAEFLNLSGVGGETACETESDSRVDHLHISGADGRRAWRTDRGIRVGATARYLASRYGKARRTRPRGERWMVTGRQFFGVDCPCTVPRLYAKVSARTGKVTSLNLLISGAGD